MIQFLDRTDLDHYRMFCDALDEYWSNNDHAKAGYTSEGQKVFVELHKELFLKLKCDDYLVLGDIVDGRIYALGIGFPHSMLLHRAHMHLTPTWHLAFTWRNQFEWGCPKQFLFDITNPISLHMERKGIFEFTKVMKVSRLFNKLGAAYYVDEVFNRNVPDGRYNAYVEAHITPKTDLSALPNVQRMMLPDKITHPLIIVKHVLKNELRDYHPLRQASLQDSAV